jgi:hypothetical protein
MQIVEIVEYARLGSFSNVLAAIRGAAAGLIGREGRPDDLLRLRQLTMRKPQRSKLKIARMKYPAPEARQNVSKISKIGGIQEYSRWRPAGHPKEWGTTRRHKLKTPDHGRGGQGNSSTT